jgi:hypothetical protein
MITYMGRAYVTLQGCESKKEALKVMRKMAPWLEDMVSNDILLSYNARLLYDEDIILDEYLEPKEILLFTDNQLPAVYCAIAIDMPTSEAKETKISDFEKEFGLKMFRTWTAEAFSKKDRKE